MGHETLSQTVSLRIEAKLASRCGIGRNNKSVEIIYVCESAKLYFDAFWLKSSTYQHIVCARTLHNTKEKLADQIFLFRCSHQKPHGAHPRALTQMTGPLLFCKINTSSICHGFRRDRGKFFGGWRNNATWRLRMRTLLVRCIFGRQ